MPQHKDNWPTVPATALYPEIAAVLKPGEQVYWQGRPRQPSLLFNAGAPILLLGAIVWFGGYTEPLLAIWESYSLLELLPFLLVAVIFCGLIIITPRYKAGLFRYALTSERALSLKRGRTEIYRHILRHDVFIHCVLDGRRDLPSLLERRLIR